MLESSGKAGFRVNVVFAKIEIAKCHERRCYEVKQSVSGNDCVRAIRRGEKGMFDDELSRKPPCGNLRKAETNREWIREREIEKLNARFERFIASASIEQLKELEKVYELFASLRKARLN
jgi:hypothetical protein